MEFKDILKRKQDYYGETAASFDFAVEEYATRRMIEENQSILRMAELHMDERAVLVIKNRIDELERMIKSIE